MDRQDNRKISGISPQIDTFLFDLDGTLIDSSKDICIAVNYALEKLGFSPLPEKEIIKHVGYGGKKLIEGVLPDKNSDIIDETVKIFRDYYFKNPAEHTVLYPYAEEFLEKLKKEGKKTGIVTNKYEDISRQIIKKLGIEDLIDIIVGGDTTPKKKPEPDPILYALENLDSDTTTSIIIGDSEADIIAGKKAGIKTGLVTYGFGNTEYAKSFNPDVVIASLKELFEIL